MNSIKEIYDFLEGVESKRLAVAAAADEVVLSAVCEAYGKNIVRPVLVGNEDDIRKVAAEHGLNIEGFDIVEAGSDEEAARIAAGMVSRGEADILMKGLLPTGTFLRAVLNKDLHLKSPDRLISTIAMVESKKLGRILYITDPGLIPAPTLEEKAGMIRNVVEVARRFGIETPKVAALCGSEAVNEKISATVDAAKLEEMNKNGEITDCIVAGPISLDLAVSEESAAHKGYSHPVAGKADILLCPDIEAANILYKSLSYFADIETGGVMAGTSKPVVFMSRTDTPATKANTIAFAAYASGR
ncbi:MAG: phosphate butyryltransferase [Clostridiales Family XIII bacterium]|jgi:phosphate butyryltransferase|nr:phosphate butyryltransferase [Clostridiales Family XIII bacterium]